MIDKLLILIGIMGILCLAGWSFLALPELEHTTDTFEISAENIGEIRLSDTVGVPLSDPIKMVFGWDTNVIKRTGNELLINTKYIYKDILTDEVLWVTVFDETVDKYTRQYTDKPGYFMFPHDLEKKDYLVYDVGGAVVNYNFIGVTEIDGLEVYEFSGQTTFDVSNIYPDFEEQIFEDYSSTNFIEPTTGVDVSFNEKFTDYAIVDGQKVPILDAWDSPSEFSQKILIQKVRTMKIIHEIYHDVIPVVIISITGIVAVLTVFRTKFKTSKKEFTQLESKEKLKDELVSMLSHEIKNPLTPIKSMCDLLLMEKDDPLTGKQRERIQIILNNSNVLHDLLSDFGDVKKLDLDKVQLSKTEINLKEYLATVIESVRPFTGDKNIKLTLNLKDSWNIICDQKRISQVISNLVKNAIDFVPVNKGEIIINAEKDNRGTIISIQDNGIGIPIEDAELIFDKFKQLPNPKYIQHEGSGLGLAVCKGIIEAHGGQIWLDKDYESGTKIKFLIPK